MKYFSYSIMGISLLLCSGCGEMMSLIDYGVSEFTRIAPSDSYNHTLTDAWQSGTGGKAIVAGNIAAWVIENSSQKDVSDMKSLFRNAADSLISNENLNQSDVHNWFGGMLCMGDEMLRERQKRQEKKKKDEDAAWNQMIEGIRNGSGTIQSATAVIDRQAEEYSEWLEEHLSQSCDMTVNEYNALSDAERSRVDMKLLEEKVSTPPVKEAPIQEKADAIQAAANAQKQRIEARIIDGYAFDSAELSDGQKKDLDRVGREMLENKELKLLITGHTCSIGSDRSNYNVGLKRAEAAKVYLMSIGVAAESVVTESAGCSQLVAPNTTAGERSRNRRITFRVVAP